MIERQHRRLEMGRPKGSTNKPKDGAGEGHNVAGLSDAQRQALHLSQHVPSYEKALAVKKKADADFKNTCKLIKAEGGSVKSVKLTLELRTPEGEAAFRVRMAQETEVAVWNGVGIQVDMFADERQPAEDKAFEAGKRAGMAGETAKPPHDPSTKQHARWLDGHAEGQAVLSQGFKPMEKKAA
jgi:hypothetical protein